MSILCGTDFSEGTRDAVRVAAGFAGRRKEPLRLVHVLDVPESVAADASVRESARSAAAQRLGSEAQQIRALGAVTVEESIEEGPAHEILVSKGAGEPVSLIVLGAIGERVGSARPIGSTAERVAVAASSPVLVVRAAKSIEAWLAGQHTLKIVVGDDLTPTSATALRWAAGLRALGPCEFVACHVFGLIGEKSRMGIGGSLYARIPELEQANLAALRRHAGAILGTEGVRHRVEATLGRPAEPVLAIAAEERADLLVVGTRQRVGIARIWHGSSSQIVLSKAHSSVACIPAVHSDETRPAVVPALRRVLVTTDFSEIGNHAVDYAYGIVANGGTVHILHVDEADDAAAHATKAEHVEPIERLRRLIPAQTSGKDLEVRVEVVRDAHASAAITVAAERLDVDVVCMGTHGRSGVERLALGSVAQEVVERCRRQVLLVPPRRSEEA